MFGKLTTDNLEKAEDRLGGGFSVRESDIYTFKVKAAYAGQSSGGAMSVSLICQDDIGEFRETIYITSKTGNNFFVKDGKKIPLPGFTVINDLCLIATGEPLSEQDTEEKVINLYDFDAGKEVPTSVPMIMPLIGAEVSLAVQKVIEDKNVKNANGDYVPSGETREVNNIVKVFHTETKMTVAEALDGADEAKFWDLWLEKNKGKTYNKASKAAPQGGKPVPTKGAASAGDGAARPSIFGNKK